MIWSCVLRLSEFCCSVDVAFAFDICVEDVAFTFDICARM
jgi:hypothetical protein